MFGRTSGRAAILAGAGPYGEAEVEDLARRLVAWTPLGSPSHIAEAIPNGFSSSRGWDSHPLICRCGPRDPRRAPSWHACLKASENPFLRPQVPTQPETQIVNFDPDAKWPE
jgi:hypothetical protein